MTQSDPYKTQTAFVLYERAQVEVLLEFLAAHPALEPLIFVVEADVEPLLHAKGIQFRSAGEYPQRGVEEGFALAEQWTDAFFFSSLLSFFSYRNIHLGTLFAQAFHEYMERVRYCTERVGTFIDAHPTIDTLVVFPPGGIVPSTAGTLAVREHRVFVECAELVCRARGIEMVTPAPTLAASVQGRLRFAVFMATRWVFGRGLGCINFCMKILPARTLRIVVSDYWSHIDSTAAFLPDAEFTFLDRREVQRVGWRNMFKHRMRFMHVDQFITRRACHIAKERADIFQYEWERLRIKSEHLPVVDFLGYSLLPQAIRAIDDIMESAAQRAVQHIEATYRMLEKLHTNLVLLRASVSSQTHFAILPLVAKELHIPSLELQHGLEYLGPGSMSRRHAAEYIAVYGPYIRAELETLGYSARNLLEAGSPRFDRYQQRISVSSGRSDAFVVVCIVPDILPRQLVDSYNARAYLTEVAQALQPISNIKAIIKLRSGPEREEFFRREIAMAFANIPHMVAQYEPLQDLFGQADATISCYSTAILESLQCDKPTILFGLHPVEQKVFQFHFSSYVARGALFLAANEEDLAKGVALLAQNPEVRERMRASAREFIATQYQFDGHAAERIAAYIRKLTTLI